MSKTLIILNDPPYGNERSYNALRLAASLARAEDEQLRLFLIGDAASCAKSGQKVPQGYIETGELIPGAHRSSMEELTTWTQWADKVVAF